MLANAKVLYIKVSSTKENIFESFLVTWILFKRALLGRLLDATSKLRGQTASQISPEVILKVADTVEAVEKAGGKMD